jgi:nucleoside-diphosphate-sugar epimerase
MNLRLAVYDLRSSTKFMPLEQNRKSQFVNRKCLIVGCGYVGLPLGAELARQGHEVFGLRRSALAETELKSAGITPLHADVTQPETLMKLPRDFDWVVNCAAPGGGTADDYRKTYLEGNRNLIAWLADSPPKRFVYTSSTSVYGQNDGSVVMEKSPVEPVAETAKVLVETEKFLQASSFPLTPALSPGEREKRPQLSGEVETASCSTADELTGHRQRLSPHPGGEGQGEGRGAANRSAAIHFPAVILRVAGIYGPGRGHWFKQLLRGEARLEGDGSRWLNMIHRDDLIGVIIAALERGVPGEIYNAADNEPVTQLELFKWLAEKLNRPMPPKIPADAELWRQRGVTNKRVSNAKLRAELKYEFRFPDFRAGYAAEIARLAAEGFPV